MDLKRIRKALVAGLGAGLAAAGAALLKDGLSTENIAVALGLGVTAAILTGRATWWVENAK